MKILVVRFKQIGDSVLSTPICNTLKKSFPDAQVDFVVYEHIAPLFENHKYIDNVISITKEEQKNIFKYIKKVWKVTRNKYDIVIDIMSTPKSELFTLFSMGSKYRIGRSKKYRGYTYTHKIEEPEGTKNKIDKFLKMLKPLENEYNLNYTEDFSLNITSDEKEYMKNKMKEAGIDFNKPIFAIAINSRVAGKVFDINKMLKIIEIIQEKINPQIIFYYSPAEKEFAKNAHQRLNNSPMIFSNIETKSIRELAMLILNCDIFFGNEGGPRHIAHSLKKPTYCVLRPGFDSKEWLLERTDINNYLEVQDLDNNAPNLSYEEQLNIQQPEKIAEKFIEYYDNLIKKYGDVKNIG